jgi:hypothetical protein
MLMVEVDPEHSSYGTSWRRTRQGFFLNCTSEIPSVFLGAFAADHSEVEVLYIEKP